jgi:hypothetical protein
MPEIPREQHLLFLNAGTTQRDAKGIPRLSTSLYIGNSSLGIDDEGRSIQFGLKNSSHIALYYGSYSLWQFLDQQQHYSI